MDELDDAAPNCPRCLDALEPAGEPERPYWQRIECGYLSSAE
jgi:hypothetical protein